MSVQHHQTRAAAAEPLLPGQQLRDGPRPPEADDAPLQRRGGSSAWVAVVCLLVLAVNGGMAVYRSRGDPWAVAFVAFAYLDLAALFLCLKRYEKDEPESRERRRLKVAVWVLTTALTLVFSYKVAVVVPPVVAVVVWATSPSTPEANGETGAGFSWLTALGLLFLTFNSGMAIYSSNGNYASIFSVGFSYLLLVQLFYCLSWYERTPPGSPRRQDDIKMAASLLSTMLLYAVFMLLVFWFPDTGPTGAKSGTAPPLQNQ